jgi:inner membrane transporter RhtA
VTTDARRADDAGAALRRRTRSGAAMIVGTSATIQLSGAIAHGLFAQLQPVGVSALRFALGAALLLPVIRPRIRGRDATTWLGIATYGGSLAALNLAFFAAIQRVPMGIAVTFAFVAPLALALARSRRRRDVAAAVLAGTGVALLGGVDRPASTAGLVLSLACGVAWVAAAYAGRHVGSRTARVDGLALALPVAALVTLPLGLPHVGALDARALALGLVIAVVGLIAPFALELEGLRRLEPRTVAIVYSIDPAIAALVGLLLLGEGVGATQAVGMAAVMAATASVTASAGDAGGGRRSRATSRTPS